MRAVIQRVKQARVHVDNVVVGKIDAGLLVLLGLGHGDTSKESRWLAQKIAALRIFADTHGKMNLSVRDLRLGVLVVSQFTLYADCREGNRPSFTEALPPSLATPLYQEFLQHMQEALGYEVAQGTFGAKMEVHLIADGPVTILMEA